MQRREFITLLGGAAAARPLSAFAAPGKIAKIGVLFLGYPDPAVFLNGLKAGLRDLGYLDGQNMELIVRSAGGKSAALAELGAELIGLKVDVIVAYPTTAGLAAKKLTSEVPIVVQGGDLEVTGLVASLAHPGGNVTGVGSAAAETAAKNLELIAEMLPAAQRVAVLINANSVFGAAMLEHVKTAAELRKIEIRSIAIGDSDRLEADIASLDAWKPDALLVHPALPQAQIAAIALNRRLPSVSPNSLFVAAGGLASYSSDVDVLSRQCATFVDKIVKGRKPADLPAELPTAYRLKVNLRTAKAMGLSLPPTLLGRADEVIE
jgi:putative tryptophan/tyrosine transport system substrate-binding protein